MKIKRVDDKQMVIHTKEKTKIHTYEAKNSSIKAANTYTVNAENGEKTENGEYISSYECDPETVDAPEKYIGKIVKMNGQFVAYTNQDES